MLDAANTTTNDIATTTSTAATATTTAHLLEELVLGGEVQNILLVALLSLRARLRASYENWK